MSAGVSVKETSEKPAKPGRPGLPSRDQFAACLGDTFVLQASAELRDPVTLLEVEPLRQHGPSEQFSLIFRSGRRDHVPQKIYRMEHETLGSFDLFLVPVGPDDHGMRYQAVFS